MELITAPDLAKWLENKGQPQPVLLDVREPAEVQLCQIPESVHMAMHSVPERFNELNKATPIVCICHHGARSMRVAQFLEQQGFARVINLTGGIHAWATQVDLNMERY
jgi:rhodanese-related sulfurtransferase